MKIVHAFKLILTGGYAIRVSKYNENGDAKILSFPKIAPLMMVLFPLLAYFGEKEVISVYFWIVLGLMFICVVFGFFYYDIFKSERPKNVEDVKKDIINIGFKKSEIEFDEKKK